MLQFGALTRSVFFENRLDELIEANNCILGRIQVILLVGEHQLREICLETTGECGNEVRVIAVKALHHFFGRIFFTDVHIQLCLPLVVSFEEGNEMIFRQAEWAIWLVDHLSSFL